MKTLTYVRGDDWNGLYVDGELVYEGHSIDVREIFEWVANDTEIVDADLKWLENEGRLPGRLEDVQVES